MLLNAEAHHRFARFGDTVNHLLGPAILDTDHHHRGNVRIAAGTDQRAEMQIQIGTKLQAAIRMWNRHRAFDVMRHRFGGGVGKIVDRQHDDVIADPDAAIGAAVDPMVFCKPGIRF